MPKSVLTEYRLELSSLLTLLFAFLTIVGVVGSFFRNVDETFVNGKTVEVITWKLPSYLSFLGSLTEPFGDWVTWIVVAAPIGLVVCAWWLYDYVKKTRELAELIDTPSKAKFVRNIDEIDYLAWSLPQRFEDQILAKKREFKI